MASRKEQKEALRKERLEREQAAEQSAARKRLIGIVVAAIRALAIVGALVVVVLAGGSDDNGTSGGSSDAASVSYPDGGKLPEQKTADLAAAAKAAGCKEQIVKGTGGHTTEPQTYNSEPPAIGPHNPVPEEDKLFSSAPQTERLVHDLEHGRVIVWVRPDASQELLGQIKAFYDEDPYHVIVTPRKEIKEAVDASAWVGEDSGHILRCPKPSDKMWDALRAFKEKYRDKAPEFVP
jgi:hypothetical protein